MKARVWLILLCASGVCCLQVNISNVDQRRDVNGTLLDAHDGNVVQWSPGGLYYWYAMGYGPCVEHKSGCAGALGEGDCGFQLNHSVNVFTSPDLVSWTFVGDALPVDARPEGIYYRVKVVFNAQTQMYVLWINLVHRGPRFPNFFESTYVVADSPMPEGPFVVKNPDAKMRFAAPGDLAVFVDDDGSAYVAYDAFELDHTVSVEQLAPDYLSSLGAKASSGPVGPVNHEAPIMFKRAGWYYLLFGRCCCFCTTGSDARVYAAEHPLGPWTYLDDIDRGNETFSTIGAQESFVISAATVGGNATLVWVGDRWNSAPDHLKSHDLQYWQPLVFNDTASPPTIAPLRWIDWFTLDLLVE